MKLCAVFRRLLVGSLLRVSTKPVIFYDSRFISIPSHQIQHVSSLDLVVQRLYAETVIFVIDPNVLFPNLKKQKWICLVRFDFHMTCFLLLLIKLKLEPI